MTQYHQFFPPACLAGDIRKLENAHIRPRRGLSLMEAAGAAAARLAESLLGNHNSVLVLAGPGNNGGDALVAARHLAASWYRVTVVFTGRPDRLPPDAAAALQAWEAAGGRWLPELPSRGEWDLIIDGLFGVGLKRNLEGRYAQLVAQIGELGAPVLSLDVPSGLNADTGMVMGTAIRADHTLSFLCHKPGLLTAEGPDLAGIVHVDGLGIDPKPSKIGNGSVLTREGVASLLPSRPRNSHKGMMGKAGIIGGASGMVGAGLLAARAALRLGAGRVYFAPLADAAPAVDLMQPELMLQAPNELLLQNDVNAIIMGPGLGRSPEAQRLMAHVLASPSPLVLDADALNLLAEHAHLAKLLEGRTFPAVLTPHPGEAARLLGQKTAIIQQDRLSAACRIAERFRCHVALKGAGTICATPDGQWYINPTGNPSLSTAGTGDVLAGMIGAFVAQGLSVLDAVLLGVYLHGAAADAALNMGIGPIGFTAGELTDIARRLLNEWVPHPHSFNPTSA